MTNQNHGLNLDLGLYMADSYMRNAERAIKELESLNESESKGGPVCLATSSYAFSLEIYFKCIIYCTEERQVMGHDLVMLWNELQEEIQNWFSKNFASNYKSTGKDWSVTIFFNPKLGKKIAKGKFTPPSATAFDILKGHKNAFAAGRYAYELPAPKKLKPILFNIEGLKVLSFLARGLAYYFYEKVQKLKETSEEGSRHTVKIKFPGLTDKMQYL